MAIKFRCGHCRGLLGIGTSHAGGVVDCPRCGRSIRVPRMDGAVEPIPEPTLDFDDSGLVEALSELAGLEEQPEVVDVAEMVGEAPAGPETVEVPVSIAAAVPDPGGETLEAEVIDPAASLSPAESGRPLEELASLAHAATPADTTDSTTPQPRPSREWVVRLVLLIVGFTAGALLPQLVLSPADSGDGTVVGANGTHPNSNGPIEEFAVRGRVSYRSESGQSLPDRGARVIVFPLRRQGVVRLSVIGFRAGDDDADSAVAGAGWSALGGGLTVVDEEGGFAVSLPQAGRYRLLVLSRYHGRDPAKPRDAELERLMAQYFDQPLQLLGQLEYRTDTVQYDGTTAANWEFTFTRD